VIAKKNIPTAVQRNRVKRVVRETFRHQEFTVAMDIVFLARNRANQLSTAQLTQLLSTAWVDFEAKCVPLRLKHA
jgi:ribonuclease P protein component